MRHFVCSGPSGLLGRGSRGGVHKRRGEAVSNALVVDLMLQLVQGKASAVMGLLREGGCPAAFNVAVINRRYDIGLQHFIDGVIEVNSLRSAEWTLVRIGPELCAVTLWDVEFVFRALDCNDLAHRQRETVSERAQDFLYTCMLCGIEISSNLQLRHYGVNSRWQERIGFPR